MVALPGLRTTRTRHMITGLLLVSMAIGLLIGVVPLTRDARLIAFFLNGAILAVALVLMLINPTKTR